MKMRFLHCMGLTTILALAFSFPVSAQLANKAKEVTGKFQPTLESFKQYRYPEWFRDAKFGIWAHWGPQAVPRQGDWYAKKMYQEGSADYKYHLEHYGHPSEFGYKDIIPLWKAQKWDPDKLMALYKKAGAKYFVSMATHHDDFFLWDSKIHRWNAVNMGPKKDVVGLWQKAARKEGLRFGVSEHLAASYTWFQSARGADTKGSKAGVPYDGANPAYEDLYHPKTAPDDNAWLTNNPENQKNWLACITELIDKYHPDLLYSDSELPFGETGRNMLAHFYNQDMAKNGGKLEAVYTCKLRPSEGRWVQDIERGMMDSISPFPWQTDTSIGDWFYRTGQKYLTGTEVIRMLVDIVSKNGNLLINVVQTPEGDLEPDVMAILNDISKWIPANGAGIYGTRPWKIYGEGPLVNGKKEKGTFGGLRDKQAYSPSDIRFTTKNGILYAYCMGNPAGDVSITSLGRNSKLNDKAIASVKMLGSDEKLNWKQQDDALVIQKPAKLPDWTVIGFEIRFKK
ncbi:MAG: alpha-L-fucosidase [Bacteroidota bacterium]|nr:alpha-L-fucosidase [Bacteroidota bacterium]